MADQKISELTNITGANLANADEFVVVDVSADQTKAVTRAEFFKDTPVITVDGSVTAGDMNITGPTPVLTITDNDGTSQYTSVYHGGGTTVIDSRNGDSNGPIRFRGAGGGVADEYARFVANGNFGIGTESPSEALSVTGNIAATGSVVSQDEVRAEVIGYANSADAPYMVAASTSYTGATTNWGTYGFQHRLKSNSGGVSRITVDSRLGEAYSLSEGGDAIFAGTINSGNITVTSASATPLHVDRSTSSGAATIQVSNSTHTSYFGTPAGGGFAIDDDDDLGTAPWLDIDTSGNTTINGTFTVKGSTGSIFLTDTDVAATSRIWQTAQNLYIDNQSTTGGDIYFRTNNGVNRQIIRDNGDVSWQGNAGGNFLYWDASALSLGIGTTSPSATLDVVGNAEINGFLQVKSTTPLIDLVETDSTITTRLVQGADIFRLQIVNNGSYVAESYAVDLNTTGAVSHRWKTQSSEVMRIDSSGALLHGTTTAGSAGAGDIVANGGIYLGGTVAANKLDDYEEGTWTPVISDASSAGNLGSAGTVSGYYTKIGREVTVRARLLNIVTTGMTSGNTFYIQGLPFTSAAVSNNLRYTGSATVGGITFATGYVVPLNNDNSTFLSLFNSRDTGGNGAALLVSDVTVSTADVHLTIQYMTS